MAFTENQVKPSSVLIVADYEIAPKNYLTDMSMNSDNIYIGKNTEKTASIPLKDGTTLATSSLTKYLNDLKTGAGVSYAANVGSPGTKDSTYVTASDVIDVTKWYKAATDPSTDAKIDKWFEIENFLNGVTTANTLTGMLAQYVTLGSALTITGAKTFSQAINGDILGNATTADRFKNAKTINGVSFDGSSNITVSDSTKVAKTGDTMTGALTVPTLNVSGVATVGSISGTGMIYNGPSNINKYLYVFVCDGTILELVKITDKQIEALFGTSAEVTESNLTVDGTVSGSNLEINGEVINSNLNL